MTPEDFIALIRDEQELAKRRFLEMEDNSVASKCWIAMLNTADTKGLILSWHEDPNIREKVMSIFTSKLIREEFLMK